MQEHLMKKKNLRFLDFMVLTSLDYTQTNFQFKPIRNTHASTIILFVLSDDMLADDNEKTNIKLCSYIYSRESD